MSDTTAATTPANTSDAIVWRGFTQATLDAAYNNMAAVADSAEWLADWTARSAALRALQPGELDIAYSDRQRQRFDMFRCGLAGAPLLVFIHGGWWQRNSKEVFSCMAEGPLADGFDVALLGYTLAPDAPMPDIIAEIWAGLHKIAEHNAVRAPSAGCILSGWSAGGHLTAMALEHPFVRAGLSISGVFDLEPIRHSYINDRLQLSEADAVAMSPSLRPAPTKPLLVMFGEDELPELQRQSVDYATACQRHGASVEAVPLPGKDHFSILDELCSTNGKIVQTLRTLTSRTTQP